MANYKLFVSILFISRTSWAVITFSGLSEDASITKNNFLCPAALDAQGSAVCQNRVAQAINFEFDSSRTLQLFNNQQFWVQRKYKERQLLMARAYRGADLTTRLKALGWDVSGGFSIVITTDPLITENVQSKIVAAKGEMKVVAQLWYNGDNLIQLWAEDAALITDGQTFSITVSNSDSTIAQEQTAEGAQAVQKTRPKTFQEIKKQFLQEIQLSPRNIIQADYSSAFGSPKNIKIVLT